ncbi:MAG: histone deacetylase family protein [Pseudomonadota bacterium]
MSVGIISHPDCLLHDMGQDHPEQPLRVAAITAALEASPLIHDLKFYQAPLATPQQLALVHPESYIQQIFAAAPTHGLCALDPETIMNPHSLTAACRAAGAVIQAVDLVMAKEHSAVFCNVRPPGHHAERNHAMGFCFFNNVAIGAAYALAKYQLPRVAIVDFDVHHGNGTEDIFRNEDRVLLCSSFQHPFYPYSGTEHESKNLISIPLPAGASGKMFRELVTTRWLPALNKFKPEMIFFSAGFDGHAQERMAELNFLAEDYAWVTEKVAEIAKKYAQGRMVSVLEGGYNLAVLGECVVSHVSALSIP